MAVVEKKSVVRESHAEAINEFHKWKEQHPSAPLRKQIKQFDMFVDSACLKRELDKLEREKRA